MKISDNFWRLGMSTSEPKAGERVKDVCFSEDTLSVHLIDGRTITNLWRGTHASCMQL